MGVRSGADQGLIRPLGGLEKENQKRKGGSRAGPVKQCLLRVRISSTWIVDLVHSASAMAVRVEIG